MRAFEIESPMQAWKLGNYRVRAWVSIVICSELIAKHAQSYTASLMTESEIDYACTHFQTEIAMMFLRRILAEAEFQRHMAELTLVKAEAKTELQYQNSRILDRTKSRN